MNISRRGKIARLPEAIRAEVNRRLDDGVEGKKVVAWLNALPEVQAIVATEFAGRLLSEQNLSQWRKGGYQDWLREGELRDVLQQMSLEIQQAPTTEGAPPAEIVAQWVAARYALAMRELRKLPPEKVWPRLRALCADVSTLRRGEHAAQRLALRKEYERQIEERAALRRR